MNYVPNHIVEAFGDADQAKDAVLKHEAIWKTGFDTSGRKYDMVDALNLENATIVIPHVFNEMLQLPYEPLCVCDQMLQEIQYTPGMIVQYPALGAIEATDLPPHREAPVTEPSIGGETTFEMAVGRSGLAFRIYDDVVKYSKYDLVRIWLAQASAALKRHKERKFWNYLLSVGTTVFDNTDKTKAISGKYTGGIGADGNLNGAMTMDDLMEMIIQCVSQGFVPDTIVLHPLNYLMWLQDPVLRTFALSFGGGMWFNPWVGNMAPFDPTAPNFGGLGQGTGQSTLVPPGTANSSPLVAYDQHLSGRPVLPGYAGFNFNIIPSPFMPYDVENKVGDIMMFRSGELGVQIVEYKARMKEERKELMDLSTIQIDESYGFALRNEAQGIVVARYISAARNYLPDRVLQPPADATALAALGNPETDSAPITL